MNKKKSNDRQCSSQLLSEMTLSIRAAFLDDYQSVNLDSHGNYHENSVESSIFCNSYASNCLKKTTVGTQHQLSLENDAFISFISNNARLLAHDLVFPDVSLDIVSKHESTLNRVLIRARTLCHEILSDFSTEEWYSCVRHSSGTTLDLKYSNTNLEDKWSLPLSTTDRMIYVMDHYLKNYDTQMLDAIKVFNRTEQIDYRIHDGSRATTVDKSQTARRMIAIEPTVNMFFQQGLMSMMYDRLLDFGLDIASLQVTHQKLVEKYSITGEFSTIDFASASDCVSKRLVQFLIPPKWYYVIDMVSSECVSIYGTQIPLAVMGTMGNACTFPLETIVFYSLMVSTVESFSKSTSRFCEPESKKMCSAYGDDCILPHWAAPRFIEVAEACGFLVNVGKSHVAKNDRFRESCGSDFYSGRSVRIPYFGNPSSMKPSGIQAWLYTLFNLHLKKHISYFGKLDYAYQLRGFHKIISYLCSNKCVIHLVTPSDPDDSGLQILSEDFHRLGLNLFSGFPSLEFHPVGLSIHGTLRYSIFTQSPPKKEDSSNELHYVTWLKSPTRSDVSITKARRQVRTRRIDQGLDLQRYVRKSSRGYVSSLIVRSANESLLGEVT